jgi:chromosome segregation ATPase
MGTLNKIVSISILVLAIAAAVFSFLLFQKRGVLVDGWTKLTSSINDTAKAHDYESGNKTASKLTDDSLENRKYERLDQLLPDLKKQASSVNKQRNELADALTTAATTIEIDGAPEAKDLKDVSQYDGKKTELLGLVDKVQAKDKDIAKQLVATGSKLGVQINEKAVTKVGGYKAEIDKYTAKVTSVKTRVDTYDNYLKQIASAVGAAAPPATEDYPEAVKTISTKVATMKTDFVQAKKDRDIFKTQVGELQTEVAKKDQQINESKNLLATREKDVAKLKKDLAKFTGEGDGGEKKVLETGSPETLKLLKGKVVEVSKKWDFVVLDIGSKSKVEQVFGNKKIAVDVIIPRNEEMLVARRIDGDNSEFVGKVKIVKVMPNSSIANIVPSPLLKDKIREGDIVFFSDETINKITEKNKAKVPADAKEESEPAASN